MQPFRSWPDQTWTGRSCHGEARQRTAGEVQASGGRPSPEQGFASLDLMVSPSLENDAKVDIETENTSLKHYKLLLNT